MPDARCSRWPVVVVIGIRPPASVPGTWLQSDVPRQESEPDEFQPASFDEEEAADLRRHFGRQAIRLALAFGLLFAVVWAAFWWSGSAIRFGASRVAERAETTWRIIGTVRDGVTRKPVPWAAVADDPGGLPPFFHTDADQSGVFELLTLPEPHQIRVSASGYKTLTVRVGRAWFLWLPQGREKRDIEIYPE
jgi:hypothetical protein